MPRWASVKRQTDARGAHIQGQRPTGLKRVFGCTTVHANKTRGRRAWDLGVWVWEKIPEGGGNAGGGGNTRGLVCCPDKTNTLYLSFLLFGDVIPEFAFVK